MPFGAGGSARGKSLVVAIAAALCCSAVATAVYAAVAAPDLFNSGRLPRSAPISIPPTAEGSPIILRNAEEKVTARLWPVGLVTSGPIGRFVMVAQNESDDVVSIGGSVHGVDSGGRPYLVNFAGSSIAKTRIPSRQRVLLVVDVPSSTVPPEISAFPITDEYRFDGTVAVEQTVLRGDVATVRFRNDSRYRALHGRAFIACFDHDLLVAAAQQPTPLMKDTTLDMSVPLTWAAGHQGLPTGPDRSVNCTSSVVEEKFTTRFPIPQQAPS